VPRRLAVLAAVLLVASVGAGCSDGGAPAARAGDDIVITNAELMDEVAEWAGSPLLLQQARVTDPEGAAPGSYATALVDAVLTFRIQLDLHREQFDALSLTVDPAMTGSLEEQLAPVLDEVSPAFGEQLVGDLVRLNAVSQSMGEGYAAWFQEATASGVEVSSRYGAWDPATGTVVGPDGPRAAASPILEL
jgi:hypothetical protein